MQSTVIGHSHLGCYKLDRRIEQDHGLSRIGSGVLGFYRRLNLEDERQLQPNEAGAFGDDGRGFRRDWLDAAMDEGLRFAALHTEQCDGASPELVEIFGPARDHEMLEWARLAFFG